MTKPGDFGGFVALDPRRAPAIPLHRGAGSVVKAYVRKFRDKYKFTKFSR